MRSRCLVGLVFLAAAAPAVAGTFVDEAAWRAAIGGVYTVDDFESYSDFTGFGNLASLGLTFAPLQNNALSTVRNINNGVGGNFKTGPNVLLNGPQFPGNGQMVITATGGGGIYALGYWNVGNDDRTRLTFRSVTGAPIAFVDTPSVAGNLSFQGIVSDVPAAFVTIEGIQGNGWFSLDDMQVSGVPTPGGLGVLAAGGLLAGRRRR